MLADSNAVSVLRSFVPVRGQTPELTRESGSNSQDPVTVPSACGVQLTLSGVASPDAGIPPLNHAEVTVE